MECPRFLCDQCGLCCEHLNGNPAYQDLDDGSGTCRYYDRQTRLCTIYYQRPMKCNVQAAYALFCHVLSYEEYISLNTAACKQLKRQFQDTQKQDETDSQ